MRKIAVLLFALMFLSPALLAASSKAAGPQVVPSLSSDAKNGKSGTASNMVTITEGGKSDSNRAKIPSHNFNLQKEDAQPAAKPENITSPSRPDGINLTSPQQLKKSVSDKASTTKESPIKVNQTIQPVVPAEIPLKSVQPAAPGTPLNSGQTELKAIPGPPPQKPAVNVAMPPVVQSRAVAVAQGTVSLNFDDADIFSVIQTVFGEILKYNYIIDARVKGRVTFRSVAPVVREKVLPLMEVILRLNGVAIIEESELYRIIPISDLSREPSEIKIGRKMIAGELRGKALLQIVPLNYVQSSEIVKLINPFVSANAVIVDVPKANHIIIADTDANVKRILQLIEYFDAEVKEKKGIRVFVYHVQNTKAKDLVSMLQQIFLGAKTQTMGTAAVKSSYDASSSQKASIQAAASQTPAQSIVIGARSGGAESVVSEVTKIFADERLNAIVILGTREDYDIIKQTIVDLDLVPRQVLIEGMIASVQLTDNLSLGLAWSFNTNLGAGLNPINVSFNPSSLSSDTSKTSGLNIIGVDASSSVRALINALASESKAKLLASPHIMVSDNNEARIQVGQQVPITTSETYGSTTIAPQRTIQYKDIGIILKVKPLINDGGLVNLQLSQEVSTYTTEILYADEKQIILNKTEATTSLVVKDGQTIVIGGLIREDDNDARQGFPWLIKIPFFRYLFGNTSREKKRTELVILLTPHIVKDQYQAAAATRNAADKITDPGVKRKLEKSMQEQLKGPDEAVSVK